MVARQVIAQGTHEQATHMVKSVARALAAFQQRGPDLGPVRDRGHWLTACEDALRLLELPLPQAAKCGRALLGKLTKAALDLPHLDMQCAHGDFNHNQVVDGPEGATIIDLDEIGRAEPFMDAANFIAHLRRGRIHDETSAAPLDRAEDAFRESYLEAQPHVSLRHLEWATALFGITAATNPFRRQVPGWPEKVTLLLRQASELWSNK